MRLDPTVAGLPLQLTKPTMPDHLFHNPYHFIPSAGGDAPGSIPLEDWDALCEASQTHVTHARFGPDLLSGRLICRLVTLTPLVIGGGQHTTPEGLRVVEPFTMDGQPAIPASSLRGLVSSLAEAASNSALRVLDADRGFSFRKEMTEGLSAVGMVIQRGEGFFLRPLCLPHLQTGPGADFSLGDALPRNGGVFTREMFPQPVLKVYLGTGSARKGGPDQREIVTQRFLQDHRTFELSARNFHTLNLAANPETDWQWEGGRLMRALNWQRWKAVTDWRQRHLGDLLLEQRLKPSGYPVRGLYRTLGVTRNRIQDIPTQKKHELFIPYTERMEAEFEAHARNDGSWQPGMWREFEIAPAAVARFHALAGERTAECKKESAVPEDQLLPFHPHGTRRNEGGLDRELRLKSGDLVFFRPDEKGQRIVEISFSSIWRGRVETLNNGQPITAADFFAAINRNLPPLGSHPGRDAITIVEQLFGFVEDGPAARTEGARAMASRLRFSFGRPSPSAVPSPGTPVILKILASPKPPSPNFYFKRDQGEGPIKKRQLAMADQGNPDDDRQTSIHARPQGRKVYLHHPEGAYRRSPPPWESERPQENQNQKAEVRPLPADSSIFYFHVDFDNLSRLELGLLCYAIRPEASFAHKLGLGKPLGLGSVRIDPMALLLIHRASRYGQDPLDGGRYYRVWKPQQIETKPIAEVWPADVYRNESALPANSVPGDAFEFDSFRAEFARAMGAVGPEIIEALKQVGDPSNSGPAPVHYPPGRGGSTEVELFDWFVKNERSPKMQYLAPLPYGEKGKLPVLHSEPPPAQSGGGYPGTRPGGDSRFRPGQRTPPAQTGTQQPDSMRPQDPTAAHRAVKAPEKGDLANFRVVAHEKDKRVRFETILDGRTWVGYLEVSQYDRARWLAHFAVGWTGLLTIQGVPGPGRLSLKAPTAAGAAPSPPPK